MRVSVSFLPLLRDFNPVIGHLIFSYTRRWLRTEEGTRASKPGKVVLHLGPALCSLGDLRQVTWLPSPAFSHLQRGLLGRCNGSSGHLLHIPNMPCLSLLLNFPESCLHVTEHEYRKAGRRDKLYSPRPHAPSPIGGEADYSQIPQVYILSEGNVRIQLTVLSL